ncbi:hypothetical protein [Nakamurella leprariae]|uniref:Uncharacterized protein n=1 Tax=Nakamurella leprariae TaxID=2803911 RepID=A0A938YA59_9ACTN|nr:hypothetical protein [Nakamurella leprariae]MBM9468781.1 hypothetical protein [Nakamurella leprariae]
MPTRRRSHPPLAHRDSVPVPDHPIFRIKRIIGDRSMGRSVVDRDPGERSLARMARWSVQSAASIGALLGVLAVDHTAGLSGLLALATLGLPLVASWIALRVVFTGRGWPPRPSDLALPMAIWMTVGVALWSVPLAVVLLTVVAVGAVAPAVPLLVARARSTR